MKADGTVLGGLSVAGPADRLKSNRLTEETPGYVLSAANELERYMEHST